MGRHPTRTPPSEMAEKLAALLREEELDYGYVKEVFRLTRRLLELGRPPSSASKKRLTPEEAYQVYEATGEMRRARHRTMLRLQMLTGLRTSELIGIRLEHVDLERMLITLPETDSRRERLVMVPSFFREELTNEVQASSLIGEGHLFLSHHRRPYKGRYVRRLFRQTGERAGVAKRVTADTMRLQLLVYLAQEGMVGEDLLEAARARSPTVAYGLEQRLNEEEKRAAVERAALRIAGRPTLTVAHSDSS